MSEKPKIKAESRGETVYTFSVMVSDPVLGKTGTQKVRAIQSGPGPLKFVIADLAKAVGNTFSYGPFLDRKSRPLDVFQPAMGNQCVAVTTMDGLRPRKVNNNSAKMVAQKSWMLEICEAITEAVAQIRESEKLPPLMPTEPTRPREPEPVETEPCAAPVDWKKFGEFQPNKPIEVTGLSSIQYLKEDLDVLGYEIIIQKKEGK